MSRDSYNFNKFCSDITGNNRNCLSHHEFYNHSKLRHKNMSGDTLNAETGVDG
jgi:hypothetical protein